MALGSNTYYNPSGVTLNGQALAGVLSVSWGESAPGITSSADAEAGSSIAGRGDVTVNWSVTFRDPVVAKTAYGLTGDLVFVANKLGTVAANKTYTIKGAVPTGISNSIGRNGATTTTVSGVAAKDDGTTAVSAA